MKNKSKLFIRLKKFLNNGWKFREVYIDSNKNEILITCKKEYNEIRGTIFDIYGCDLTRNLKNCYNINNAKTAATFLIKLYGYDKISKILKNMVIHELQQKGEIIIKEETNYKGYYIWSNGITIGEHKYFNMVSYIAGKNRNLISWDNFNIEYLLNLLKMKFN